MRSRFILIAVFAALGVAHGNEFHLTDESGKEHGPFVFKHGEKLVIAGKTYTISKIMTDEEKTMERMKRIVIPEINFRQANIHDVFAFIHEASVQFDQSPGKKRGVGCLVDLAEPRRKPPAGDLDPFARAPIEESRGGGGAGLPMVTFTAKEISVYEAVDIVCRICDLGWSVTGSNIRIERK